jgi:uncharacterized membrane protein YbaN (DUF454 family)
MDSQRAKEILLLYRPGASDANDPEFADALEQAERDPELARWFEAHCARQSLVRHQLKHISVPQELRQRILDQVAGHSKIVWWRRPSFHALAAAAAIVLVAGLAWFWTRSNGGNSFADYRDQIVRGVQRFYDANNMDMLTNNLTEIRAYLAQNSAPSDYVLTKPMEKLPGIGCNVLKWRSNKVSLVCLDSGNKNILYLFVVDRSAVSDPPRTDPPQFVRIRKLMSASWSHEGRIYILAASGEEDVLRRFL